MSCEHPIRAGNSECALKPKIEVRLTKQYDVSGGVSVLYFFTICCPQVIKVCNACTDHVTLKIPACFKIEDQFFQLVTDGSNNLFPGFSYSYMNMSNGVTGAASVDLFTPWTYTTAGDASILNVYGNALIDFGTAGVSPISEICLMSLVFQVTPKCLSHCNFVGEIGELECTWASIVAPLT